MMSFVTLPQALNPSFSTNAEDCKVLDLDLPEVREEMIPDLRDFVIE